MKSNVSKRAIELFNNNIPMIADNPTTFRRKVMQTLVAEYSISVAAAATYYNNAKKLAVNSGLVTEFGRVQAAAARDVDKFGNSILSESECYTVLELTNDIVTRTKSYLYEDDATTAYNKKLNSRFSGTWKLIKGMGPNVGDTYRLQDGEVELTV
jgi:hypothetical protein